MMGAFPAVCVFVAVAHSLTFRKERLGGLDRHYFKLKYAIGRTDAMGLNPTPALPRRDDPG